MKFTIFVLCAIAKIPIDHEEEPSCPKEYIDMADRIAIRLMKSESMKRQLLEVFNGAEAAYRNLKNVKWTGHKTSGLEKAELTVDECSRARSPDGPDFISGILKFRTTKLEGTIEYETVARPDVRQKQSYTIELTTIGDYKPGMFNHSLELGNHGDGQVTVQRIEGTGSYASYSWSLKITSCDQYKDLDCSNLWWVIKDKTISYPQVEEKLANAIVTEINTISRLVDVPLEPIDREPKRGPGSDPEIMDQADRVAERLITSSELKKRLLAIFDGASSNERGNLKSAVWVGSDVSGLESLELTVENAARARSPDGPDYIDGVIKIRSITVQGTVEYTTVSEPATKKKHSYEFKLSSVGKYKPIRYSYDLVLDNHGKGRCQLAKIEPDFGSYSWGLNFKTCDVHKDQICSYLWSEMRSKTINYNKIEKLIGKAIESEINKIDFSNN